MKGQVFIMAAVVVLIALLILQNSLKAFEVPAKTGIFRTFYNIKQELARTVDLSLINNEDIEENLDSFIEFSSQFMKTKGYVETVQYSISSVGSLRQVSFNLTLASQDSYIEDNFIINRTVQP